MRVTQTMMTNDAIRWMAKQADKLNEIATVVGSGKQVNKPSDDPDAMGKILTDRTTLSQYAQYIANISQADTWIEADNSTLEAVSSLLDTARAIVISNISWDEDDVDTYIEQLESIYDQVVDLANTKLSSTYLYSGSTSTAPFANETEVAGGTASDIVFNLAGDASTVAIDITDASGEIVRTLTVAAGGTGGTNTISWDGLDDNGILLADGSYSFTASAVDASGNAVAAYETYRGNADGKAVIVGENSTCTIRKDGGAIFTDALNSLSQTITAMKYSTYDSDLAANLDGLIKDAITDITTEQVSLANILSQMTAADTRFDALTVTIEDDLSTVEEGSTEEAAVKLTAQETAYETTMSTIASVLKMSKLTNYIS